VPRFHLVSPTSNSWTRLLLEIHFKLTLQAFSNQNQLI
jgi:hypothetical protein